MVMVGYFLHSTPLFVQLHFKNSENSTPPQKASKGASINYVDKTGERVCKTSTLVNEGKGGIIVLSTLTNFSGCNISCLSVTVIEVQIFYSFN